MRTLVPFTLPLAAVAILSAGAALHCSSSDDQPAPADSGSGDVGTDAVADTGTGDATDAADTKKDSGPPCTLATGTSGSLLTGFKSGMKTALSPDGFKVRGALVDKTGGILVYGTYMEKTTPEFGLARFGKDGDLDSSFGTGGVAKQQVPSGGEPLGAAIDPATGRIALAGNTTGGLVALVIFDSTGKTDTTTLDSNGNVAFAVVDTPTGGATGQSFYAVSFDAAGKLLLAGGNGTSTVDPTYGFLLRVELTKGKADTAFNKGKPIIVDKMAGFTVVTNHGKDGIFLAGTDLEDGKIGRFQARALNADGSIDTTWAGSGGISEYGTTANDKKDRLRGVAFTPNGNFGLAGSGGAEAAINVHLDWGLLQDGHLAVGGGFDANVMTGVVTAQCDDKLVLGGGSSATGGIRLDRFSALGPVDAKFGKAGVVSDPAGATGVVFSSVVFDPASGSLVVVADKTDHTGVYLAKIVP